ncbi:hypothetical protein NL676_038013 [Syzygium grande]|nr:hypothetical protein NL676_038013 [Syzygium grande]
MEKRSGRAASPRLTAGGGRVGGGDPLTSSNPLLTQSRVSLKRKTTTFSCSHQGTTGPMPPSHALRISDVSPHALPTGTALHRPAPRPPSPPSEPWRPRGSSRGRCPGPTVRAESLATRDKAASPPPPSPSKKRDGGADAVGGRRETRSEGFRDQGFELVEGRGEEVVGRPWRPRRCTPGLRPMPGAPSSLEHRRKIGKPGLGDSWNVVHFLFSPLC